MLKAVWHDQVAGPDGKPTRVPSAFANALTALYGACLQAGWYPKVWKVAEVVPIPKIGRSRATTKGLRPISLLPCAGKGLERLVAGRMGVLALQGGLIHSQHAGGVPQRLATDLLAAAVHDVEDAQARGLVVGAVTADVEGAFNMTQKRRLEWKLVETGWDRKAAYFCTSFLTDRVATIRGDPTGAHRLTPGGLPQGSPLSPILFTLYLAAMIKDD